MFDPHQSRRPRRFQFTLAVVIGMMVLVSQSYSQLTTLYNFKWKSDGAHPSAGLLRDGNGNLYGTTRDGGTKSSICTNVGCGVVFKLDPSGHETVLHSFKGGHGDGDSPEAALISDGNGNLYGTTVAGGAHNDNGTVFKVTTNGTFSLLYSFRGSDGSFPAARLLRDDQGNFYGTTAMGGSPSANCPDGCGTVFKLTPSNTESVLYSFTSGADGNGPEAPLIFDASGNLYGTASGLDGNSHGSVFEITASGSEITLHTFTAGSDGATPEAKLLLDSKGNLYGTASTYGQNSCACGVVFKILANGTFKVIYTFNGANGSTPLAGVVEDADGNLYGTTISGGAFNLGTIFEKTKSGQKIVLHSFSGSDGSTPLGILMTKDGTFYGVTQEGGAFSAGTVFKFVP